MKSVFVLQHSYESSISREEETKFIGVYSSKDKAKKAADRLSQQPGFKELTDYFYIDEYKIDQDHWEEGFITQTYEPIWSVWRQDDNNNIFLFKNGLTETDALRLVKEYEAKGHKQTYWAKENR